MGQPDEKLSAGQRVAYYRSLAAEALKLAQIASDDALKASYLDIAAKWNTFAAETERGTVKRS